MENSVVLVGRYTRSSVKKEDLYSISHLVFMTEVCKMVLACGLEFHRTNGQLYQSFYSNNIQHPWTAFRVSVPAILYFIQNCLVYVGLTNLPAPVFHVTQQMKLVVVAMVSVLLMQRRYTPRQWTCLIVISIGVAVVSMRPEAGGSMKSLVEESSTMGLISVSVGSFCSALAGVYFEKILKSKDGQQQVSLWMRNIQLAFFSIVLGVVQQLWNRSNGNGGDEGDKKSYFHGFTKWVWTLVILRASSGMLVATIIKYADNVIKGIVTALSVIVGCVLSRLLFGVELSANFVFGASLVLSASYMFSNKTKLPSPNECRRKIKSTSKILLAMYIMVAFGFLRILGLDTYLLCAARSGSTLCIEGPPSHPDLDAPRLRTAKKLDLLSDESVFNTEYIASKLHFHVFGAGKPAKENLECDGCRALWLLHLALKESGFETTGGRHCPWATNTENRTMVLVHPESSKIDCKIPDAIHVRWMLSPLGVVVAPKSVRRWGRDDLVFHFATSTGSNVTHLNVLQVTDDPTELEEMTHSTTPSDRSGIAWVMNHGERFHRTISDLHEQPGLVATQLPMSEPPANIRKYKYFVSYDPYLYWTWFAAMEGTISVVHPIEGLNKMEWGLSTFLGAYLQHHGKLHLPGVAYGWGKEEIQHANKTLGEAVQRELLKAHKWGKEVTVPRFVHDCYRYSIGERSNFESGKLVIDYFADLL